MRSFKLSYSTHDFTKYQPEESWSRKQWTRLKTKRFRSAKLDVKTCYVMVERLEGPQFRMDTSSIKVSKPSQACFWHVLKIIDMETRILLWINWSQKKTLPDKYYTLISYHVLILHIVPFSMLNALIQSVYLRSNFLIIGLYLQFGVTEQ